MWTAAISIPAHMRLLPAFTLLTMAIRRRITASSPSGSRSAIIVHTGLCPNGFVRCLLLLGQHHKTGCPLPAVHAQPDRFLHDVRHRDTPHPGAILGKEQRDLALAASLLRRRTALPFAAPPRQRVCISLALPPYKGNRRSAQPSNVAGQSLETATSAGSGCFLCLLQHSAGPKVGCFPI